MIFTEAFKRSFKCPDIEDFGLSVYNSGYQRCESGHSWGPAIRDHYSIHFISSGRGSFFVNDCSYSLTQGDLFIIYPHCLSHYCADNNEPWQYYWVGFNGTQANRLVNLTPFDKNEPVIKGDIARGRILAENSSEKESGLSERLKKLLLRIYMSRGNMPENEVSMSGYLQLFLSELIKISSKLNKSKKAIVNTGSEYVKKAMQFIQYNYSAFIGVEDIASYTGISRSHLYRVFIEETGFSPSEFLQKHRISEACVLLRKNNLSIWEIANSVGFSDPLYFSKAFKKIKGISPSKYNK